MASESGATAVVLDPKSDMQSSVPKLGANSSLSEEGLELNDGTGEGEESVQPNVDQGVAVPAGPARPADDEILLQENSIKAEEAGKMEFIGDKEPLSALAAEYERGNEVFKAKIQKLGETYGSIRRTRGDGNCFFRGFMFAYLERLLHSQDKTELPRMRDRIERCKQELIAIGYTPFTFEDFLEIFMDQLESVLPEEGQPISLSELEVRCRDPNVSNWAVMFFRFVTSAEVQRRAEFFEPFILGLTNLDVKKFCQTSVEPMGEESDHVHITALTDALGIPVRIVYLDRSGGASDDALEINHHDFVPESAPESFKPDTSGLLTLLYRPGHYDILYSL